MYQAGKWKAVCDRCGFEYLNTALSLEWTGLRVCRSCLDHRHPQETIVSREDRQAPEWVRPVALEVEVTWLLTEAFEPLLTENNENLSE